MSSFERDCILAQSYLGSPDPFLWRWEEGGRVLCWSDGTTIAFAEEIEHILKGLEAEGLPSFTAIILILTATQERWRTTNSIRESIKHLLRPVVQAPGGDDLYTEAWLDACIAALDRIHELPEALRKGMQARRVLIAQVLEACPLQYTGEQRLAVYKAFTRGIPERLLIRESHEGAAFQQLMADLDAIRIGMEDLKAEDLERRRDTGLADEVGEAPVDLSLQEQILKLMESLEEDEELDGLARLTRHLIAAVHLPRPLSAQQDLPLGGFSDISNKGPLDRLLLSEMAHDDLVLMVRIALNEALYLKREAPPNHQISDCAVLVDAGVRSWGIPRVYSTAVALAAGATAGQQRALSFYQGVRGDVVESDLRTRDGIVNHLAVLDAAPHPGAALKALLARPEGYTELLLITQRDVMTDEDFRELLRGHPELLLHVASVDRDGRFEFMEIGRHGTKVLRTAQFDLQDILFSKRKKTSSFIDERELNDRLPAIFSLKDFPLLLPVSAEAPYAVVLEGVLYCLTNDGRLMVRADNARGCRQLTAELWKGVRFIEADYKAAWIHTIVYKKPGKYQVLSYKPELEQLIKLELQSSETGRPTYVGVFDEYIYAVTGRGIIAWHVGTGNYLGMLPWELDNWNFHKRFFLVEGVWSMLVINADNKPAFEPLTLPCDHTSVRMVFTTLDDERPQLIQAQWKIVDFDGNEKKLKASGESYNHGHKRTLRAQGDIRRVCSFSKNGLSLAVQDRQNTMWEIGAATGQVRSCFLRPDSPVVPEPAINLKMGNMSELRQQFLRVAVAHNGCIILESKKHHLWCIMLNPGKDGLILNRGRSTDKQSRTSGLQFKPLLKTSSPYDSRIRLRVAQFGDALRIFLDSRGLLHVKPMGEEALEFTLVLKDDAVAGWCSDGSLTGTPYVLGDHPSSIDAKAFYQKLTKEVMHAHVEVV